jgi:glycosyltransferase involved in cell wall biosynthesis
MAFSIIIPLYNKQNFIARSVNSVLAQVYEDFELIIVNDGSTDNSLNVISSIHDNRIKIVNKTNGGVSSARNAGVDVAVYDWVCFLDADDYWLTNHLLEINYLLCKYPEGKIFTTLIQENSNKGLRSVPNEFPDNFEGYIEDYFCFAKTSTVFNSSSVCIYKKALIAIDKFDTNLTHGEDLEVWFKLLFKYKGVLISKPTVVYDLISENRAMQSFCNFNKHLLSKINLYRNDEIYGLNDFIDYFTLRNSVPYYFSNNRNDVIPLISLVKDRKTVNRIWSYIYNENMYLFNFICYKLYKKIKTII